MVTADSSCHAGGDSNGHQGRVGCLECVYNNRNQNTKGTPGSSGCKCQETAYQEDDCRKQIYNSRCASFDDRSHKLCSTQAVGHGFQGPCKGQDHNSRYHGFEALRDAVHALFESKHFTTHIQCNRYYQCKCTSYSQTYGCITVGECSYKILTCKKSTGPDHSNDTADNQRQNRNYQVFYASISNSHFIITVTIWTIRCSEQITIFCIVFMHFHRTEVNIQNCNSHHHNNRQQCIEVIRNGTDEKSQSVFTFYKSCNCCCPGRDRCNNADRSCGCINQISQFCT